MSSRTTMGPPVCLDVPRRPPEPAPGCDVCVALAKQRTVARGLSDLSAVSDCNVELAAHPEKHPMARQRIAELTAPARAENPGA
ncbi:hypothetical protein AB0393_07265 [Streptomyces cyaneofuscatus]|uniref:hypothetical protein n=1 Tax=Streptomyces cyaneofuscatus TaxID=66883 RepID=UPI00344B7392